MNARLMSLPEFAQVYLFVGACLALVAIPGPAVAFIVARSVSEGTRAGVRTAAGIAAGNLCQALAAAFGLAALLVSYPSVYQGIKYAGAGYLIYLGLRSFFAKTSPQPPREKERNSPSFRQGALVGLLNPKVALFLLAFLPQFTSPENGELWLQLLFFGLGFVIIGWIGDSIWALCAGFASSRLRKKGAFLGDATPLESSIAPWELRPLYGATERNRRRRVPLNIRIQRSSPTSILSFPSQRFRPIFCL